MKLQARTILGVIGVTGYILLTGGFFACLFFGEKISLPEGEFGKQILGMLGIIVGTWTSAFSMVFVFNYGTSQGSKDKDVIVQKILERNQVK